jgi:hypothetical protein
LGEAFLGEPQLNNPKRISYMGFFMENSTNSAQEAAAKIPKITQNAADSLGKALQNIAENLVPIMDRLAGTQSTLKLSFQDLTLDTGMAKAKITGSINFEVTYAEQTQTSDTS